MRFLALWLLASSAFASQSKVTTTPIKHVIVIFQENHTFDNYFATYPFAQNNPGETPFFARENTPSVNGLSGGLLTNNPNLTATGNAPFGINPFRLTPAQGKNGFSLDPSHDYLNLQIAGNAGLMDQFIKASTFPALSAESQLTMGYFDGNTVTALWNYAQYFAMSDNCRSTTLGPSTIGAINLISGQTSGASPEIPNVVISGTIINDPDPKYDICGNQSVSLAGINVGNLLNAKNVTWGWFQGGFANCHAKHNNPFGPITDYVPHHDPFQYYQSTSNPEHLPPSSFAMVGLTDQANHNYDLNDFWSAAAIGNVPAVSFLKAPKYQNGHGRDSTQFLEQQFLVATINKLQTLHQWKNMAIIILYDDSGGWYDHEPPPIINDSQLASEDRYTSPGECGSTPPMGGYQGRPGYGFRVPCLVISPWAKDNFVDHTLIDQTSVLRFIEDNWNLGRIGNFSYDALANPITNMFDFSHRKLRYLYLNPNDGTVIYAGPKG